MGTFSPQGGRGHGAVGDAGQGLHGTGAVLRRRGLHLYVNYAGRKSWVLRITVDGRRRDIGLGGFPSVSLARAREKAADNRTAVAAGRDPLAAKRAPAMPTFREAARAVHEVNTPRWRNVRHVASWMQTLERRAMPALGNTPLDRLERGDVLRVLNPIWTTRPETARRVRQRMRTVFRWAIAHGFMEVNLAGEAIDGALPPMPKVKAHLRSLPYQDIGAALDTVEASQASVAAKLCFRFLVLTAARSGEARGAVWDEVDLQGQVWRVPAERMKAGVEHRAPLSRQALELLRKASALGDGSGLVFPSVLKPGSPMSDMTLTKVLRSTGLAERATVHGFRSSFKNWTLEQTDTPWAVSEAALAHMLGNSTEQAYARSDLFERRRALMQRWADYLTAWRRNSAGPRLGCASGGPDGLLASGRDSNQAVMSLSRHRTAARPTRTGGGKSPALHEPIERRAPHACDLLNLSTPQ